MALLAFLKNLVPKRGTKAPWWDSWRRQPAVPAPTPKPTLDESDPNYVWLRSGTWVTLASSNVEAVRYDYAEQILEIEFKNGSFYDFHNVPPNVALGIVETDSPGRYVWNHIRDLYPYAKLTGPSTKKETLPYPQYEEVAIRRLNILHSDLPPEELSPTWERDIQLILESGIALTPEERARAEELLGGNR